MKQALGSSTILYIIIVFLVVVFAFIGGAVIYYRAYKLNNKLTHSIEKYEGYNNLSYTEINSMLGTMGYTSARKNNFTTNDCPRKHGVNAVTSYTPKYMYCIYPISVNDNYDKYGVLTYIRFGIFDSKFSLDIKIPVYSETERIYKFNEK